MARTLTLPKKGTGLYTAGWHTATISKAKYGTYNDAQYIDVWFDGYAENFNMRVYAKKSKDGEEFAIGNLFRFANAGITDALESAEGETVIKMDDSAEALTGKTVNIFLYKDGKYSRVLQKVAPVEFTNVVETITENDVTYHKGAAEKFFKEWVEPKLTKETEEATETATEDVPF
ncbi:MAG: hypothetical protein GOVbin2066_13 [Prokaryotic dsDNA virus sp.]|nr:MAG: hypothetical protein GOVbin2066_13 [Prokaryotic dsDNA virus sp.]|tara:strand:+ start:589 stop:1113 length:525 start_codon:yes stop_codon:yes gene_type:complete